MTEQDAAMSADDLEDMRATVAAFLDEAAPPRRVREVMGTGYDDVLWDRLRDELGLIAAAVPERCGGLGLTFADSAVLLGEFARRLIPVPFAEMAVASALLDAAATPVSDELLAEIAETAPIIALGGADPLAPVPTVSQRDRHWTLAGTAAYVPFGHQAEILLLAAKGPDGLAVYAVRTDDPGVRRVAREGLDATRPLAELNLDGASAQRISADGCGPAEAELLRGLTLTAQATEAAAGAAAVLDLTVGYLKVREQFGRPIGSFQALKHRCADHAVTVAGACSTARHAALAAMRPLAGTVPDDPLDVIAPLAKAVCADAFFRVAGDAIQLHGGIGFTFEHDAHLYFKRAKATQHLYGHPDALRTGLAAAAGL